MQPFQCDLQPQHQETHRTTHTGTSILAKLIGGTNRVRNDRSRNRRTDEVPFIVASSHFTRKNTRFRAPEYGTSYIRQGNNCLKFGNSWGDLFVNFKLHSFNHVRNQKLVARRLATREVRGREGSCNQNVPKTPKHVQSAVSHMFSIWEHHYSCGICFGTVYALQNSIPNILSFFRL